MAQKDKAEHLGLRKTGVGSCGSRQRKDWRASSGQRCPEHRELFPPAPRLGTGSTIHLPGKQGYQPHRGRLLAPCSSRQGTLTDCPSRSSQEGRMVPPRENRTVETGERRLARPHGSCYCSCKCLSSLAPASGYVFIHSIGTAKYHFHGYYLKNKQNKTGKEKLRASRCFMHVL